MQFFIDSQGTVTNLISSPVYQGSTNASELVLVAPLSASNVVTAVFKLPNGLTTTPRLMTVQGQPMVIDGNVYNLWRCLLDGAITEYAGGVSVFFEIYNGGYNINNGTEYSPIKSTTYASSFTVQRGGVPTLPDAPTQNIYDAILAYLAELNPQYNIANVMYSTTNEEEYKIKAGGEVDNVVSSVSRFPASMVPVKPGVKFTRENVNGGDGWFYAISENFDTDTGFIINFEPSQTIGKMQINFEKVYYPTILRAYAILNDENSTEVEILEFEVCGAEPSTVLLSVNGAVVGDNSTGEYVEIKGIKLVQPYAENVELDNRTQVFSDKGFTNGRFYVKSLEFWHPTTDGYITITSSTGRKITLPEASYDSYINESKQAVVDARTEANKAQASAVSAEKWATGEGTTEGEAQYDNSSKYWAGKSKTSVDQLKKNEPNGVAGLDGNGLIYANQIPAIVKHEYFEIESESELTTLENAEQGDIAYLLNEAGDTVLNSWILLGGSYDVRANWKEQSTATAGSAAYADQARTAQDASAVNGLVINGVLSEAQYASLESKQGVYFVSIEATQE